MFVIVLAVFFMVCPSQQQFLNYTISDDPDDVRFYFYPINGNPVYEQEIVYNDTNSLLVSDFNFAAEKTILLIHGFTDNRTVHMNAVLLPAYLDSPLTHNYIVVDWDLLSANDPFPNDLVGSLMYIKVVNESVPIVSQRMTEFLDFLGVDPSTVHLIGHSLGAHIAGRVGLLHQENHDGVKLARITGLDPAGPLFDFKMAYRKLNSNDAAFVDVIHTNAGQKGDNSVDGHVDFFPNGGALQPGCDTSNSSCSHQFAPLIYATSLVKDFPACECVSTDEITGEVSLLIGVELEMCLKDCPTNTVLFGENCPNTARGLYSLTTSNPP